MKFEKTVVAAAIGVVVVSFVAAAVVPNALADWRTNPSARGTSISRRYPFHPAK